MHFSTVYQNLCNNSLKWSQTNNSGKQNLLSQSMFFVPSLCIWMTTLTFVISRCFIVCQSFRLKSSLWNWELHCVQRGEWEAERSTTHALPFSSHSSANGCIQRNFSLLCKTDSSEIWFTPKWIIIARFFSIKDACKYHAYMTKLKIKSIRAN